MVAIILTNTSESLFLLQESVTDIYGIEGPGGDSRRAVDGRGPPGKLWLCSVMLVQHWWSLAADRLNILPQFRDIMCEDVAMNSMCGVQQDLQVAAVLNVVKQQ